MPPSQRKLRDDMAWFENERAAMYTSHQSTASDEQSDSGSPSTAPLYTTETTANEAPVRRRGIWIATAALTCPCHLPIYAAVLSGTAAGTLLSDNLGVARITFGVVFFGSLFAFMRTR